MREIDGTNRAVRYGYDTEGNQTTVTVNDGSGDVVTRTEYGDIQQAQRTVRAEGTPDEQVTRCERDALGCVEKPIEASGTADARTTDGEPPPRRPRTGGQCRATRARPPTACTSPALRRRAVASAAGDPPVRVPARDPDALAAVGPEAVVDLLTKAADGDVVEEGRAF